MPAAHRHVEAELFDDGRHSRIVDRGELFSSDDAG